MKICQNCFQAFDEMPLPNEGPTEVLGNIFLDSVDNDKDGTQEGRDLCPSCRETLGAFNMLGFDL